MKIQANEFKSRDRVKLEEVLNMVAEVAAD